MTAIVANLLLWSVLEPCVSIVTACLPTLGPLVTDWKIPTFLHSLRSLWSKVLHTRDGDDVGLGDMHMPHGAKNGWQELPPSAEYYAQVTADRRSSNTVVDDLEANRAGVNGIKVDSTIASSYRAV